MRPIPIPDALVGEEARRLVLMPPNDRDVLENRIAAVEVLVDKDDLGDRACVLVELEEGDVEQLLTKGRFWLVFYGGSVPVFAIEPFQENS